MAVRREWQGRREIINLLKLFSYYVTFLAMCMYYILKNENQHNKIIKMTWEYLRREQILDLIESYVFKRGRIISFRSLSIIQVYSRHWAH